MSKVGLEYVVTATATVDASTGEITYSGGKNISPAAAANATISTASGKDYGDNRIVAVENEVTGGTITLEFNHDEEDIKVSLLGHTKDSTSSEIEHNVSDVAPYVGVGMIGKNKKDNAVSYKGKWYSLVQFHEPNDENATRTESVTFGHTSLEGEIIIPESGLWKREKTFETLAAAKTWINGIARIQ